MTIWKIEDGGDIFYVFAQDQADAEAVFVRDLDPVDLNGWKFTELTLEQADVIEVKDEDGENVIPTTLGAIFRANPERGYVCGTTW